MMLVFCFFDSLLYFKINALMFKVRAFVGSIVSKIILFLNLV